MLCYVIDSIAFFVVFKLSRVSEDSEVQLSVFVKFRLGILIVKCDGVQAGLEQRSELKLSNNNLPSDMTFMSLFSFSFVSVLVLEIHPPISTVPHETVVKL